MAVDKLVDSSQLDADLTSVANAIRTKGGTSAQLAFPADFVSAIGAIPTGGGGGGVSGTFTPASDARSITLSDCIGKTNILIFPMFDLASGSISVRAHWGCVIIGGRSISQSSTNTAASSYVANVILSAGTGQISSGDTFDSTTGTVAINIAAGNNYGGYFISGKQYGYVAW